VRHVDKAKSFKEAMESWEEKARRSRTAMMDTPGEYFTTGCHQETTPVAGGGGGGGG
jgi:hypothetical protein